MASLEEQHFITWAGPWLDVQMANRLDRPSVADEELMWHCLELLAKIRAKAAPTKTVELIDQPTNPLDNRGKL